MDKQEGQRRYKNFIDEVTSQRKSIDNALSSFRKHLSSLFTAIFGTLFFIGFNNDNFATIISHNLCIRVIYFLSMLFTAMVVILGLTQYYLTWLIEDSALESKESENEISSYLDGKTDGFRLMSKHWPVYLDNICIHAYFVFAILAIILILLLALVSV